MNTLKQAAIVIGANGGIAQAVLESFQRDNELDCIVAVSRTLPAERLNGSDVTYWIKSESDEDAIKKTCEEISHLEHTIKYIIIAIGLLHNEDLAINPEKRIAELDSKSLHSLFDVNTFIPLLWLKELTPLLRKDQHTTIAVLSARVGSIGDNHLGGWYSYRASKAALNMLLKSLSIEYKRRLPKVKLIAFHPGTTDTQLSKPFQNNVPSGKLFSPEFVAQRLHQILIESEADGQLAFLDWAGKPIDW